MSLRGLSISLIIHAALLVLCWILTPETSQFKTTNLTTVDLLEDAELAKRPKQPPADEKTFVRSAPAPKDLLTDEEKKKRFASENVQNVIEEQQARKSGMTANRSSTVETPKAAPDRVATNRRKLDFKPESALERLTEEKAALEGDIAAGTYKESREKGSSRDGKPLDFSKFGSIERGVSTIGEQLPTDISVGDFTALNTDRHLYYTFYSRIEEMIRARWVNYIRAVVYGMETGVVIIPSNKDWTTKIEIVLDRTGVFRKAILHESSGSKKLDSAPVQAFRDARQFPNPPVEMIKEDGNIHLMYAFSVQVVPSYAADSTTE